MLKHWGAKCWLIMKPVCPLDACPTRDLLATIPFSVSSSLSVATAQTSSATTVMMPPERNARNVGKEANH